MSMQSKTGGGSRASDEDTKTAVKVGEYIHNIASSIPGPRSRRHGVTPPASGSRRVVSLAASPPSPDSCILTA